MIEIGFDRFGGGQVYHYGKKKMFVIYYRTANDWYGDGNRVNTTYGDPEYIEAEAREGLMMAIDALIAKKAEISAVHVANTHFSNIYNFEHYHEKSLLKGEFSAREYDYIEFITPIVEVLEDFDDCEPLNYDRKFQKALLEKTQELAKARRAEIDANKAKARAKAQTDEVAKLKELMAKYPNVKPGE